MVAIRGRIITSLLLGVVIGAVVAVGVAVNAWTDPTQAPPNGGGLRVTPTGSDPGCSVAGDIGKLWMNSATDPDVLRVCRDSGGTPGWQDL